MNITFTLLSELHFPFLLKWLETPHVKAWWDQDVKWTLAAIEKKYGSYVKGYKIVNNQQKPIYAYIIQIDKVPIGYIQTYNARDYPRTKPLSSLPESMLAFDIFIGEQDYLGHNIGSTALKTCLANTENNNYTHAFANPDIRNIAAIKAYEKAGFQKIQEQLDINELWMLKSLR